MFLIQNTPANAILTPIVELMADKTPTEVEQFVRRFYTEQWFDTVTESLQGNVNRLNHRIRSIRSKLGLVAQ